MFYVYLLRSTVDGNLYIGYTSDLKKRVVEHNKGKSTSTRRRVPLNLVYYEVYMSQTDAMEREKRLKSSAGAYTALKRRLKSGLRQGRFV